MDFGDSDISQILFNCGCIAKGDLIYMSSTHCQYTRLIYMKLRLKFGHENSTMKFSFTFLILIVMYKKRDKRFENKVFSLLK